ncbi:hypothetical protein [Kitasatospora terrestris]|uniref:ATP/GTP-binding protein n=1 Tax=Kitasatospora terrestris TaxID=258051 RepID=A0ABP9DMQ4_9ACTN
MTTADDSTPDDLEFLLAQVPVRSRPPTVDPAEPSRWFLPPPIDPRVRLPPQANAVPSQVNIDVLANTVENLHQETRRRDTLEGTLLNRRELEDWQYFVEPEEWRQSWADGRDALRAEDRRILLIVGRRGHGVTTFARHLSARHASRGSTLLDLETDWEKPSVGRFPLGRGHTYLLELKDPDNDRIDSTFLERLSDFSSRLRQADSRLVATVTDILWKGHHNWAGAGVTVVRLPAAPDAQQLVEHHLKARGLASLIPYVQSPTARASIRGRNAVEAMRSVETVIRQWVDHQKGTSDRQVTVVPGQLSRPYRLENSALADQPVDDLQTRIEQALTDWRESFDVLFNEPGLTTAAKERPLSLPNRCLLLSLAVHQAGPAAWIGSDAQALEAAVGGPPGSSGATGPAGVAAIFAGQGLRPRLTALGAEVDLQDQVVYDRPGYAEAALVYVWDNFPPMRTVLLDWLVNLPVREYSGGDPAVRALSALILRHKDPKHLDDLRERTLKAGRGQVLAAVTERALGDGHMSSGTWQLLGRWAKLLTPVRAVVADICRSVLTDDSSSQAERRMAMTRLRSLARTESTVVDHQVLPVYDALAKRPESRLLLVREVENWLVREGSPAAGRLALLALMPCTEAGHPWLYTPSCPLPHARVQEGLRELFSSKAQRAEGVERAAGWLRASVEDSATAELVLDGLASALRGEAQGHAALELLQAVRDLYLPDSCRASDRLLDHIGRGNAAGRPPRVG